MAAVRKVLVAIAGVLALPVGATLAGDPGCTRPGTQPPAYGESTDAAGKSEKPRLLERSVDPANDRAPRVARATGKLAMKALSVPLKLARWIKTKTAKDSD